MSSLLLLGAGTDASAGGGGGVSWSVEGIVTGQPANGTSFTPSSIVTTATNEILFLVVTTNGAVVSSISDASGLTWTAHASGTGSPLTVWKATSAGAITATPVVTLDTTSTFIEYIGFAVKGGHIAAPFDANAAVPTVATGSPVTLSTSNANDMLLSFFRDSGVSAATVGWTRISTAGFTLAQYQTVSATQSGLSIADPNAGANSAIATAIIAGP